MDETKQHLDSIVKIKVIGVGGGGSNTIHSMIQEGIQGVDFIVANTDQQALNSSIANDRLTLGKSARGLGAGANPEEGHRAAMESESEIRDLLEGADMVIIASGMGGGTGTGASPVIAKVAKGLGALTIGIVTTPFAFEGTKRIDNAKVGLDNLRAEVDSLIVVSNDKLLQQFGSISLKDSFMYADKVLKQTVRTITDLIALPALINLDFADVTTVMRNKGPALIGIGKANGQDKAIKAATHAISSPILEASIFGAQDAIINISGGDITLDEANKAVETIKKAAGDELNIIFGVSIVESLGNDIQVSVIATGLKQQKPLTQEQIKHQVSQVLDTIDLDFEDEGTRELLVKDPFPESAKMHISEETRVKPVSADDSLELVDEDETDDLPSFLRR
ncbi:cell division protein FtsZ [Mycoplasma sp. ATU-Cv-703]|uniref:cell division protein FtsZ n=1 Tax=Mycoplasma sp. ATU-Cv-703 TaxID=2498595 RepID=UPI000FDCF416